jgi:hypothetical protein
VSIEPPGSTLDPAGIPILPPPFLEYICRRG